MKVITRSGKSEAVDFNKVKDRLTGLAEMLGLEVNTDVIARETIAQIVDGITTTMLDEHSARIAADRGTEHHDYYSFAGAICVSNLHKETSSSFVEAMEEAEFLLDSKGNKFRHLSEAFMAAVRKNAVALDAAIDHRQDYTYDYFGFQTLTRSYLIRKSSLGRIIERPQHMHMRVALFLHMDSIEEALRTYGMLSRGVYTHATPTMFNAGTVRSQLASCFLMGIEDSVEGIYKCLGDVAGISKHAGGIGIHVHNIRARGSVIRGTNGVSNGLVPMLQVFNSTSRYIDQGGGKRKGSVAIYIEPWHADILDFLEIKRNTGDENMKARDLFMGMWIPDLFMERVRDNRPWSLFCPERCADLVDLCGVAFASRYEEYEAAGLFTRQVRAQDLFQKIMETQVETGVPYMLYKDSANAKSNQQNLGTIRSSNLCAEIIEYSDASHYAVCNLASLNLTRFVNRETRGFDYERLREVAYAATKNLDRVIDLTYYPNEESRRSNMSARPVGLGVQGLADVFFLLGLPFGSREAREANARIFETIYYGAVEASADMAVEHGGTSYEKFAGSPFSRGQLQFDFWENHPKLWMDWASLKERVKRGMRNSLLTAVMPTASTAQIMGNYECVEPPTNNIFMRRTLAGQFTVVNRYLQRDLAKLGLWTTKMKDMIVDNDGSIAAMSVIPQGLRDLYKTVWEIPQKALIDMSIDRAPFVDQSQSLNLFMAVPDYNKLFSMHMYGWKNGLKTGMYYLRTRPAANPIKYGTDQSHQEEGPTTNACSRETREECTSCSA